MRGRAECRRHQRGTLILATLILAFSCYVDKVLSSYSPDSVTYGDQHAVLNEPNFWPVVKRNIGSLVRDGYIKGRSFSAGYKRTIVPLVKNAQLSIFQSPEDSTEQDTNEEKRNIASIARLRSLDSFKRNIASLARNGFRSGKRTQLLNYDDKRYIGALARNGYLRSDPAYEKKGGHALEDENYFPFYQHPLSSLSDTERSWPFYNDYIDGPVPSNELSNSLSVLPQLYDKRNAAALLRQNSYTQRNSDRLRSSSDTDNEQSDDKRSFIGLPNHGLYGNDVKRSITDEKNEGRVKRSMNADNYYNGNLSEDYDDNSENEYKRSLALADGFYEPNTFDKRHIGSLARLGWLPSFRYSGSRYSRSGRARLFYPSNRDLNRQYSIGPYFRIRQHNPDNTEGFTEAKVDVALQRPVVPENDAQALPAFRETTMELPLHQIEYPVRDILTKHPVFRHNPYEFKPASYFNSVTRTTWDDAPTYVDLRQSNRNISTVRSLTYPSGSASGKRYLLLPAVDKILLRKTYPNNTLPSRRKNLFQSKLKMKVPM